MKYPPDSWKFGLDVNDGDEPRCVRMLRPCGGASSWLRLRPPHGSEDREEALLEKDEAGIDGEVPDGIRT